MIDIMSWRTYEDFERALSAPEQHPGIEVTS